MKITPQKGMSPMNSQARPEAACGRRFRNQSVKMIKQITPSSPAHVQSEKWFAGISVDRSTLIYSGNKSHLRYLKKAIPTGQICKDAVRRCACVTCRK